MTHDDHQRYYQYANVRRRRDEGNAVRGIGETAGGFTIPSLAFPLGDRHIEGIEFPGVIESASVIYYRTRHT